MIQHNRPRYIEQLDSAIYNKRVAAVLLAVDGFRNRKEIQDVTGIPQRTCWAMIDKLLSKDVIFSLEESKNGSPIYKQARWFKKLRLEGYVRSKFITNGAPKSQAKIPMSLLTQSKMKIKVYNVVLNYIQNHNWINYDNFADNFTDELLNQFQKGNFDLDKILDSTKGSFLKLNNITKDQFLNYTFRNSILKSWNKTLKYCTPVFRFSDIFSKILIISDKKAENSRLK